MLFYFSATGNCLYAAKTLSSSLNEPIVNIAEAIKKNDFHYTIQSGEKVGFLFPIYAWGLPKPVVTFLKKMKLCCDASLYTFAVATCGDNIGLAMNQFEKLLKKKKIQLNSGFSLPMPDNYVVLFDVAPQEKQKDMLQKADKLLQKISKMVLLEKNRFFRVQKGRFPFFKSTVIHFLFFKFYTNTKRFYATGDCIGCGKCEAICPCSMIHIQSERPHWKKGNCYMCLACLNRCPKKAIQYTKQTEKHGRYQNPNVSGL